MLFTTVYKLHYLVKVGKENMVERKILQKQNILKIAIT